MTNKSDLFVIELLQKHDITFKVLDLGASGYDYAPFSRIKPVSHIYMVDADDRDFEANTSSRVTKINQAIVASDSQEQVTIHLAKNPHCSSTLLPDFERLKHYTYTDFFKIERSVDIPATSISRILSQYDIDAFDWIKLDTQGTECRILKSIPKEKLDKLLLVDVEISFYPHYKDADTFPELHQFMDKHQYWIADYDAQSRIRMNKIHLDKTLSPYSGTKRRFVQKELNLSPTSPEIRYQKYLSDETLKNDYTQALRLWGLSYFTNNMTTCVAMLEQMKKYHSNPDLDRLETLMQQQISQPSRLFKSALARLLEKYAKKLKR